MIVKSNRRLNMNVKISAATYLVHLDPEDL